MELTRRLFVLGLVGGWPATAFGKPVGVESLHPEALPPLPLSIAVAERDGEPVVSPAWLGRQVGQALRLMSAHGLVVAVTRLRLLAPEHAALEDAADRDALAAFVEPKVINLFVVDSLRDVDDPKLLRMGVRWRQRRDLSKDYVILAASAMPTTMAHELGHFFGNGHSQVVNNIMSYHREDPAKVAFDPRQGAKMRRVATQLLARGRVEPYAAIRPSPSPDPR